jgi:hypothetical protein
MSTQQEHAPFLAQGPFVWGTGVTPEEAVKHAMGYPIPTSCFKPYLFTVFQARKGERPYCDDMGYIYNCEPGIFTRLRVNGRRGKLVRITEEEMDSILAERRK